ncbi:ABC-type glycine betaine transport, substrate-binding protein [Leifsonia xyli subsp. cynodontis DSM 46306]|uniref:ABC-type glycine betaine transport system substrate-binding domain-containing protein n=1 Tax=Leifsonia xyli subsp. cynodontis DSM 46306 TaxID=1389489 RepID=U3P9E5_LEIXC|nr:glycine betaine ABC transporter substrate-binding protein [Leifsonia xyli]AGW41512.1 ABC-type glycine betaine transport, substrate-binding protein [Leifsonia xyli subsp. cynodontis DSM 46306]
MAALKNGDVQLADIYTTTPAIKDNGFVTLKDPKSLIAAQNIVPLISTKKASATVKEVLNKVSAELTTDDLIAMNGENQGANKTQPRAVAKKWLSEHPIK